MLLIGDACLLRHRGVQLPLPRRCRGPRRGVGRLRRGVQRLPAAPVAAEHRPARTAPRPGQPLHERRVAAAMDYTRPTACRSPTGTTATWSWSRAPTRTRTRAPPTNCSRTSAPTATAAATAEPRLATRPASRWRLWRPGSGAGSVEDTPPRRPRAERHAAPRVPAPTDGQRVRVEQVRVADAVVARVAYVMCVEPDLLGHESK